MSLSGALRTAFVLTAVASFAAADILTVGPAGSGAQFTQIQAAVTAASDDDVILVKPGSYDGIVVDKPLRILGDGTGNVNVASSVIRDIGAGEEVVLSGVRPQSFPSSTSILLSDCAGTVVLQDVFINEPTQSATGVRVTNCRRALLLDSHILQTGVYGTNRGGAVSALDSELWIASTEVSGTDDCCFAVPASHAVEVVNCTLHVWRSQLRGGNSISKQSGGNLADGGTGIKAVASTVNLFGGPTSVITGGQGHDGFLFGPNSPGGPAIDLAQGSSARIQQAIPVSGGFDGFGQVQTPAIATDGTSTFEHDPKIFPTLVSSAQQVAMGSSLTLTLEGNPGGYQCLFVSLRTGTTAAFRGVDGFTLLDRMNLSSITAVVLPDSGVHAQTFQVPIIPSLLGSTLFLQAAERLPAPRSSVPVNRFAIGNPLLVTITM
jgi:hypothetical protein